MKEIYIAYLENYKKENKSIHGNGIYPGLDVVEHRNVLDYLHENRFIKGLTKNITNGKVIHYIDSKVETTKSGINFLKYLKQEDE